MSKLEFFPIQRVFPDMALWMAMRDQHTFVISKDGSYPYFASIKAVGAKPFDGGRCDLGMFDTFDEARKACETWRPS